MFMRIDSVQLNCNYNSSNPVSDSMKATFFRVTDYSSRAESNKSEFLSPQARWSQVYAILLVDSRQKFLQGYSLSLSGSTLENHMTTVIVTQLMKSVVHMIAYALTCLILASVLGLKCLSNLITKKYSTQIIWFEAMFNSYSNICCIVLPKWFLLRCSAVDTRWPKVIAPKFGTLAEQKCLHLMFHQSVW